MRSRSASPNRGGAATLEFLLVFPVLVIATLAVLEFGILLLVQHTVTAAATDGARQAALAGSTTDHVAERVREILQLHGLDFDPQLPATLGSGDARLIIEAADPALAGERGNSSIPCNPAGPALSVEQVRVTVCVPMTNADGTRPVPDWLATFGFSLSGRTVEVSALAELE